ncbi:MAG: flagellar hook-associated protein 3 [Methylovulum sp.]|nr:MAG: flagellar hook-associated protein 3 [Methylovulum sp.]
MRISTNWSQQLELNAMLTQQSKLSQTQMQLSSGKKILTAADNPAAAARIIDLNQSIDQTTQYQSNINAAQQRLELEDSVLTNAGNVMYRIKELSVQGLNASNSQNDRITIAKELEDLNGELLNLANTKNANGEYIFSGFKTDTPAFSKDTTTNSTGGSAYIYSGDTHSRIIQIGIDRQVTDGDPGINVFGAPTGSPPATVPEPGSITNIFEAIDKFATDLRANEPDTNSLNDFDASLEKMLTAQSSVGVRLKALESQQGLNEDYALNMKTVLSGTEDLDYTEAITRLNSQTLSLQAAQQAYTQVKKLSLFNYL